MRLNNRWTGLWWVAFAVAVVVIYFVLRMAEGGT